MKATRAELPEGEGIPLAADQLLNIKTAWLRLAGNFAVVVSKLDNSKYDLSVSGAQRVEWHDQFIGMLRQSDEYLDQYREVEASMIPPNILKSEN